MRNMRIKLLKGLINLIAKIVYWLKRHNGIKDNIKLIIAAIQAPIIFIAFLAAKLDIHSDNIWLVGEMGVDAKDNGFAFYRYLKREHPKINAVYYINDSFIAAEKVKELGETVKTNSFNHMKLIFKADYIIATHDQYPLPWKNFNWREFKKLYGWLNPDLKFVFLQHGVMIFDAKENANYKRTNFDYFVTTAEREYKEISAPVFRYPHGNVIKTGISRYDRLYELRNTNVKRQIILSPTWRQYLADVSEAEFIESNYYKHIESFINNMDFLNFLEEQNVELLFLPPHREIQKFLHLFHTNSNKVKLLNVDTIDVQDVLLESGVMITDYSSISMDFGYLRKPVVYYQYDQKEFKKGHYKTSYYTFEKDGFGPIIKDELNLINQVKKIILNDFQMEEFYQKRSIDFFDLRDAQNSQRLFNILEKRAD